MPLRRGDVVLVPFPYAELTATKTRPALIVSGQMFHANESRLTVAGITSNIRAHSDATSYELLDWSESGLRKPSVVTAWLATISPRLIQFGIGHLTARDLRGAEQSFRTALEL